MSQTYFQRMVGCWQSSQPHQKSYQLQHQQPHALKRSMLRFISLYQVANLRPKVVGSACTPWVRPIMIVNLCSFAFSAMMLVKFSRSSTDDVVGLFVEVTIGRIHHVSRSQTIVNPLALFTKRLRNRTCEGHHIVASLLLDFQNTVDVKVRFSRIKATSSLGISPNSAHASSAKISTSSQARYLFSSLQMFAISGRE